MSKISWSKSPLKSLSSRIGDGIHGTPKYVNFSDYPFINGNNLKNGFIEVTPETKRVSEEEYKKYLIDFDRDTLFLSINGTLGSLAKYRGETVILGKSAAYIKCTNIDIDFLYYYLQLDGVQQCMWNVATGSTIKNLSLESIRNLQIPTPDELVQKKIASVLSALDAKIECNNRINGELEAMAKTLYEYWFVQFDFPDQNGKPYKSSGGKMVYNATLKREIPDGWFVTPLLRCCDIVDCLHSKKSDFSYVEEKYYLLQLENIRDDGLVDISNKYYVSKKDYEKWTARIEVKAGDIVITNAGRVAAFAQIPSNVTTGLGRNITATRPASISPNYFFLSFGGLDIQRQIASNLDHGAFFKSFNVKGIKLLSVLRPPEFMEEDFEAKVSPLCEKRHHLIVENQQLTKLRDWLLPMLMNGQVTVV